MKLILICAQTNNRVIGNNGSMPWHLPADLAFFKKTTQGHPIIMGRKTFLSIGRALPNRKNIVLTQDPKFTHPDVNIIHDLALIKDLTDEVGFVIGGGEIYRQTLPMADELIITWIDTTLDGDTYFPEIDPKIWQMVDEIYHPKDEKNAYDLRFCRYQRR